MAGRPAAAAGRGARAALVALALGLCAGALSSCGPKWLPYELPQEGELPGPAQPATLFVTSEPSGARVFLDGQDTGQATPANIADVSASATGEVHAVRLVKAGYYDYNALVVVYDGRVVPATSLAATLVPTSQAPGRLVVETSPAGAAIFLDGADTGKTAPATLDNVSPTSHIVEARLAGYATRRENVRLRSGEEVVVQLRLTQNGTVRLAGTVYESSAGHLVVGAEVRVEGTNLSTTTTQQGTFVFDNVPPGTYDIVARHVTADGTTLTGARRNVVLEQGDEAYYTANIVLAPEGTHGSIVGVITDRSGRPISGATVYADDGLVVTSAKTGSDGSFRITDLAPGTYIVVASAQGYENNVRLDVVVGTQREVAVNLSLRYVPANEALRPLPPEFDGSPQALTYPDAQSVRAAQYLGVRETLVREHGLPPSHPQARMLAALRKARRRAGVRAFPPANSNIEVDVFWLANTETDLAGYILYRSLNPDCVFSTVQVVRDPNVLLLADVDPTLGADQTVYYRLSAFSTRGLESRRSDAVSATPMGKLELVAPAEGETLSATPPQFSWRAMPRARAYEVVVWDAMPDFDTAANVHVVWRSDPPLGAGSTSATYGTGNNAGQPLQSGHTYYWAAVAYDAPSFAEATALSVSHIRSFVVP